MDKKIVPILFILVFATFAGLALLHNGMIPTHDGEYHVLRFYEFNKTLISGVVYPRWAQDFNFGFGIPLFTYVYPLPNYAASILHAFGLSFIDAFKLSMFIALLVGAISMYAWSKEYWGERGALVASVFYTYAPYHFVDIYIRGSVGEVWALGLFPLFLWTFDKALHTHSKKVMAISSVLLALIVFSHNILALGFFLFVVTYAIFFFFASEQKMKTAYETVIILCLGLLLSAIFWVPAIFETRFVTGLQVFDLRTNFADLSQLLIPSWGSGFFGSSLDNQMSVQIGFANLLVIFFICLAIPMLIIRKKKYIALVGFFLSWFFVLFFLMQQVSLPIWRLIPLLYYFQFPWRWLSVVILIISFLSGGIVYYANNKFIFLSLLLVAIGSTWQYASPAHYLYRSDTYYTSRSNFIDSTNSPGNVFNTLWLAGRTTRREPLIKEGANSLYITFQSPQKYTFLMQNSQSHSFTLSLAYFPGWRVYVDNKVVATHNSSGKISFTVPKHSHIVTIILKSTNIQLVAAWLSITGLMGILTLLLWLNRYLKT